MAAPDGMAAQDSEFRGGNPRARLRREEGQVMVEYVLVLTLVSFVVFSAVRAIGIGVADLLASTIAFFSP